jgi:hypothetical protein
MRHTYNRTQRFGSHTKHTFYCSCGRRVSGNGGKQHFKVEGHQRITSRAWHEQFGQPPCPDSSLLNWGAHLIEERLDA